MSSRYVNSILSSSELSLFDVERRKCVEIKLNVTKCIIIQVIDSMVNPIKGSLAIIEMHP